MGKESSGKGCGRFLCLIFGVFFGMIFMLLLEVGAGYYAYKNVSVHTVEQTLGIDLSVVPQELRTKTLEKLIPMARETMNMSVQDFCDKYEIKLPVKLQVGTKDNGDKIEIDLTPALQPILNSQLRSALGKTDEVIDYFTISNTFNLLSELDLPDFNFLHNAEYKDKPIMEAFSLISEFTVGDMVEYGTDLSGGIMSAVKDVKIMDLAKEGTFDEIIDDIKISDIIEISPDDTGIMSAIKDLKVGELTQANILSAVENLTLEQVLSIDSGATGVISKVKTLTIKQIQEGDIEESLQELTLGEVLDIQEESGIIYELRNVEIGDLTAEYIMSHITIGTALNDNSTTGLMSVINGWYLNELTEAKIMSIKLKEVLDIDDNAEGVLGALKDKTLEEMKDESTITSLTVAQALGLDSGATGILGAIKNLTIEDLKDESNIKAQIQTLKICDVITNTGTNPIFDAIKNVTIGNLNDTTIKNSISSLKIGQVIEISGTNTNKILSVIKESAISDIETTMDNLKLSDVIDTTSDKLLDILLSKDPKLNETELTQAVSDSVEEYFTTVTIEDLVNDGILDASIASRPSYALAKDKTIKQALEDAIV